MPVVERVARRGKRRSVRAFARVPEFSFIPDGGEMGALIRSINWSATSMGPPEGWPAALKTILGVILHSRHPMFLWWGPELIQFYNDAYRPSFGEGKHPVAMGQRGAECWPETWPIISPQIRDVMEQGKSSWNENKLVPLFRNGRIEDVYWTYGYSPVFEEGGRIGGTLVVCTETTQLVQTAKELEELAAARASEVRARDEFLSIASHELRTPLTGMKLQIQSAKRKISKDDPSQFPHARIVRLIEQTDTSLGRMTRLIDDMLDVSRIQAGKLHLQLEPVGLAALVRETLESFHGELLNAYITVSFDAPEEVLVAVDQVRMEQVVANLVTNTIRYAPDGRLRVQLQRGKGEVTLRFHDDGPGIPEADRERIFERFERLQPATHSTGLGIGLFIAQQIVQAHGGSLGVESGPGKGACFVMRLPNAR